MVPQEPAMATRQLPARAGVETTNTLTDEKIVEHEPESSYTRFRTIVVFAIIFVCFALVYPKFIHPAIKQAFGSKTEKKSDHFEDKFLPPRFQQKPMTTHPGHPPSNMQKRPTHHPGSRFTGEHGHVPESKGGIYVMLPLYTVGIIVFLLYTLYKILSRGSYQAKDLYSPANTAPSNVRYNPAKGGFVSDPVAAQYEDQNMQADIDDEEEEEQEDTEDSVTKITEFQLRALELKLAETEAQMKKLIAQMQGTADTVSKMVSQDDIDTEEQEGKEEEGEYDEEVEEVSGQEEKGEQSKKSDNEEEEDTTPVDDSTNLNVRIVPEANINDNEDGLKADKEVHKEQSVPEVHANVVEMEKENRKPVLQQ